MSSKWAMTTLGECCFSIEDGDWIETKDQGEQGYRLLQISNIGLGQFRETGNYRWVTPETFQRLRCNEIRIGDVLVARMPEPTGRCWYVDNLPWPAITAVDVAIVRTNPELLDPLYCSYFLNSPQTLAEVSALTVGTTRTRIKRTDLASLEIALPSLPIQKSIAALLRVFDDRITLLRETNATLEAIAQALFKSWFVDFDPVRAKMEGRAPEGMDEATAALFPDSFEESELGVVPKGWRVARLGDVTERITKGTTPTTLKRSFVESGVNFVKAESMTGDGGFISEKFAFIDDETHELLKRSQLQEGDVLISIAGTIGRIAVISKDFLPANTNQAVALIRPIRNIFPSGLVNRFLRLSDSQQKMGEKVVQAVQANLSLGTLSDLKVVVPPATVVGEMYEAGLAQIDSAWVANDQRVRTLSTLRDTLLPRLISGQLKLPEAEDAN